MGKEGGGFTEAKKREKSIQYEGNNMLDNDDDEEEDPHTECNTGMMHDERERGEERAETTGNARTDEKAIYIFFSQIK